MTPAEALASALQRASNSDGNLYAYAEHLPDDILAALAATGFVVVPEVATEEMIEAFDGKVEIDETPRLYAEAVERQARAAWTAMLAARPR